ncbi:hypothetical protein ACP70R_005601 [Stipagrostis hirtigluma subsp. patula]
MLRFIKCTLECSPWRYVLVLTATYNAGDLVGRPLPLARQLLRVPAFYLAARARRGGGQGYVIGLTAALGLSNGCLTARVLAEAPRGNKGPEQNALGNALVACLLAGISSGSVLDWLCLVAGKGW